MQRAFPNSDLGLLLRALDKCCTCRKIHSASNPSMQEPYHFGISFYFQLTLNLCDEKALCKNFTYHLTAEILSTDKPMVALTLSEQYVI